MQQNRHTCICCRVKFDSVEQQKCHFKTEWHSYNLKRKVCRLEPIDINAFQQIQDSNPVEDVKVKTSIDKSNLKSSKPNQNDSSWQDLEEDLEEEEEEEDFVDEDYDEDDIEEMLARVIKEDTCLFCAFKSTSVKGNLYHMNTNHGFFIPEDQYLIDLEGMMEYLGFKVGAGATCLWCNKQFTTLHGVQRHMINLDHCKIAYDQEKAVEFKEFYDYSNQEQIPMKPLNELVISRKSQPRKLPSKSALTKHSQTVKNQLIKANGANPLALSTPNRKGIKKFNAERAKTLMRIGMANNYTMRGRLRNQNPI